MADDQPAPGKRKEPKGAADLAQRMGGLLSGPPAPAAPASSGRARTASGTRTTSSRAASAAGRKPASNAGRGTKTVSTSAAAAPMPAEQTKPAAFYSARVSHATTPQQLAELEQIRLTENTARRAARRPAISITAMLRAAVAICLENDRLRAQMIKRAGEEWG
jgi:hypothetical protein